MHIELTGECQNSLLVEDSHGDDPNGIYALLGDESDWFSAEDAVRLRDALIERYPLDVEPFPECDLRPLIDEIDEVVAELVGRVADLEDRLASPSVEGPEPDETLSTFTYKVGDRVDVYPLDGRGYLVCKPAPEQPRFHRGDFAIVTGDANDYVHDLDPGTRVKVVSELSPDGDGIRDYFVEDEDGDVLAIHEDDLALAPVPLVSKGDRVRHTGSSWANQGAIAYVDADYYEGDDYLAVKWDQTDQRVNEHAREGRNYYASTFGTDDTLQVGDRVMVTYPSDYPQHSGPGTYVETGGLYERVDLDNGTNYLPCRVSELAPLRPA